MSPSLKTISSVPQRLLFTMFCVLTMALITACGGGGSSNGSSAGDNNSNFELKTILTGVAELMQKDFQTLDERLNALDTSVVTYCSSLGTPLRADNRIQAQADFKSVMETLQNTLMYGGFTDGGGTYGIGPVRDDLRLTQLYSWPLTSSCQVDLNLANDDGELKNAVNQRGIDSLEYLLFVDEGANHSCADNFPVLHPQLDTFDALNNGEKEQRRCAAMVNIVADAVVNASLLNSGWAASQDNYAAVMSTSSRPFETLNHISDGMFYFEKLVKEDKIDRPLGGNSTNNPPSCGPGQPCPDDLESSWARLSKENLIANMRAFQNLYHGGSGDIASLSGFDDWLISEGEDALAKKFGDEIQAVIDTLEAINGSLYDAIESDIVTVNTLLIGPVDTLSDTLRFHVLPALKLRLPQGSASDTD